MTSDKDVADAAVADRAADAEETKTKGWDGSSDTGEVLRMFLRCQARKLVYDKRFSDYLYAAHKAREAMHNDAQHSADEITRSLCFWIKVVSSIFAVMALAFAVMAYKAVQA